MDRSWWRMFLAVATPPTNDLDTRRSGRAALVATGVLASGLLLAHGLREGEGDVVAIAVAAALIVVLVLARAGWPVVDRTRAQEAAQRLAAIVQSSSDAIYSLAADRTVTSWNAAAERLLGRPAAEMLAQPIASVWPPEQLEVNRSMFERALAGEVITEVETVRLHRDGTRVAVTVSWSPIKDNAGAFTGVSVIARDITHRRQLEEQLVRQALHDPLTGLANRALFTDRLEHALARGRGPGVTVAILVINLDGFKDINDSLGHDAGDDLLTIAGMRLQGHARPGDTMARLGGDEFGVLLEDITAAEAVRSAQALLEGLATPILLRGSRPHPDRQYRHRHRRRRGRRNPTAQRRHRHVRRQTPGQGPLCTLRAGHACHDH